MLQPLLDRIVPQYLNNELKKDDENFWAARAALTYNEPGKIDRGIFSVYLFNLVKLQKDEAIFQDAGLPHAYLEGQNVEIMANSDNVLRGGLTPKHIDVNELLKHINFEETIPNIIREKKTADHIYSFITSAPDFELSAIRLSENEKIFHVADSAEIFIVLNGEILVEEKNQTSLSIKSGEAFIAFDKAEMQITSNKYSLIYRASVPLVGRET
jgi:mannose-6-phosphate isomerase